MAYMKLTKHSRKRMKERCGLGKGSQERMARKAFEEGIPHSRTKGNLNKWVSSLWAANRNANNIRLYGGHAWIFCGDTLVTVLPIPASLRKDMKKMVKEV